MLSRDQEQGGGAVLSRDQEKGGGAGLSRDQEQGGGAVLSRDQEQGSGAGLSRGQEQGGGAGLSREIKSREVELGSQERSRAGRWSWALKRDQEQGGGAGLSREIKSREVELGSHSRMVCLAAELFLNSCFSGTVFVTLFHTAVETAVSEVHKLHHIGGVPASLTLLFLQWLTISSVSTGHSA